MLFFLQKNLIIGQMAYILYNEALFLPILKLFQPDVRSVKRDGCPLFYCRDSEHSKRMMKFKCAIANPGRRN